MTPEARALLAQPLKAVAELQASELPSSPGVYAWYRGGRLFYVGETHRGLRSRIWGNHLRGNARGSTLRNKTAKAFGFEPIGLRKYGEAAEKEITAKLAECHIRVLSLPDELVSPIQAELISSLDPPMNDHPGVSPRWRIDEVRAILAIDGRETPVPTSRSSERLQPSQATPMQLAEFRSQRVTASDLAHGQIRLPQQTKAMFPSKKSSVEIILRGESVMARYDPRSGPDRERSAVLRIRRELLGRVVHPNEILRVRRANDDQIVLE